MEFSQVKETCLYVQNLFLTKDFYHSLLGMPVISLVEGSHIFFRVGTSVLLCFIPENSKAKTSPPPHFAYGRQHIAFEVKPPDYEGWKEKIQKKGVEIIQEQTWKKGLKSFYFKDPDGHLLEIVPEGMWD